MITTSTTLQIDDHHLNLIKLFSMNADYFSKIAIHDAISPKNSNFCLLYVTTSLIPSVKRSDI